MTPRRDGTERFGGPLFVFGMVRSGTSYMRELLDELEGVHLQYESNLISDADTMWPRARRSRESFRGFVDELRRREQRSPGGATVLPGVDPRHVDEIYERVHDGVDAAGFCREVFEPTAGEQGIWGNKLVERDELPILQRLFPRARYVVMLRDPRAVARSFQRFFGGDPVVAAFIWNETVAVIEDLLDAVGPRARLVRYEDLVTDTETSLEELALFLGREVPDLAVAHRAHHHGLTGWRRGLPVRVVERIESVCFDAMSRHGYEPEWVDHPARIHPVRYAGLVLRHGVGRLTRHRRRMRDLARLETIIRYWRYYRDHRP